MSKVIRLNHYRRSMPTPSEYWRIAVQACRGVRGYNEHHGAWLEYTRLARTGYEITECDLIAYNKWMSSNGYSPAECIVKITALIELIEYLESWGHHKSLTYQRIIICRTGQIKPLCEEDTIHAETTKNQNENKT